jgi:hypothetical protein
VYSFAQERGERQGHNFFAQSVSTQVKQRSDRCAGLVALKAFMGSTIKTNRIMPFDVANNQIKISRQDILDELKHSQLRNNVIGIFLKDTHELITTAVTEIEETQAADDYIISLMEQDLHGYPLDRNRLLLSNIDRVIHFSIAYDDPQYVKVRRKEKFKA